MIYIIYIYIYILTIQINGTTLFCTISFIWFDPQSSAVLKYILYIYIWTRLLFIWKVMHGAGSERSLSYESLHCFRVSAVWINGAAGKVQPWMNWKLHFAKVHPCLLLKLMQLINWIIDFIKVTACPLWAMVCKRGQDRIKRIFIQMSIPSREMVGTDQRGGAGQLVFRQ